MGIEYKKIKGALTERRSDINEQLENRIEKIGQVFTSIPNLGQGLMGAAIKNTADPLEQFSNEMSKINHGKSNTNDSSNTEIPTSEQGNKPNVKPHSQ